jgi:hypothetical protein
MSGLVKINQPSGVSDSSENHNALKENAVGSLKPKNFERKITMEKHLTIIKVMKIKILSLAILGFLSSVASAQKIVWKPLASLPQASYGGEAVAYNNKIYFVSYSDSSNPNFYEYEILYNKWKILPDLPDRGDAAAAEVDGKIYVISGEIPANTNTNFVYNPETHV